MLATAVKAGYEQYYLVVHEGPEFVFGTLISVSPKPWHPPNNKQSGKQKPTELVTAASTSM